MWRFTLRIGIRVVPEIDLPTHTASWCVGMPELCPPQPVIWNASHKGGRFDCGACSPCEPLDPTNPVGQLWTLLAEHVMSDSHSHMD